MRRKIGLCLAIMLALVMVIGVYARVDTLFWHSDGTYVTSEHGDYFLADTYYGEVSVRGTDRTICEDDRECYFEWLRIRYNVQGEISEVTTYSYGQNDAAKRIERIKVKDKWNNKAKTTVHYNYKTTPLRGNNVHSVGDSIYGGGIFRDDKMIKTWKIVK